MTAVHMVRDDIKKDPNEVEEPRVASDDIQRDEDYGKGRSQDRGMVYCHGDPI